MNDDILPFILCGMAIVCFVLLAANKLNEPVEVEAEKTYIVTLTSPTGHVITREIDAFSYKAQERTTGRIEFAFYNKRNTYVYVPIGWHVEVKTA